MGATLGTLLVLSVPVLVLLALVLLRPSLNKSWKGSLASHLCSVAAAVSVGLFSAFAEGLFGFAVGDPPYDVPHANFDFAAVWLKVTMYVLAALYALRAAVLIAVKGVNHLKGAH